VAWQKWAVVECWLPRQIAAGVPEDDGYYKINTGYTFCDTVALFDCLIPYHRVQIGDAIQAIGVPCDSARAVRPLNCTGG
jgi:hypothetical protein